MRFPGLRIAVHDAALQCAAASADSTWLCRSIARRTLRSPPRSRNARRAASRRRRAPHHDAPRRLVEIEHRDHVRMPQRRHHARLVERTTVERRLLRPLPAKVRMQELDRDIAIELAVAREIDDAGRAAAELAHGSSILRAHACTPTTSPAAIVSPAIGRGAAPGLLARSRARRAAAHVRIVDVQRPSTAS